MLTNLLNIRGKLCALNAWVMGIVNITPDSFYAASRTQSDTLLRQRIAELMHEGADVIDIGACSTRPHAEIVSEAEEIERLRQALPVIREVAPEAVLSVDTFRPSVAMMCADEFGVGIINDVEGREGANFEAMATIAAQRKMPYVYTSHDADLLTMIRHASADIQHLHEIGVHDVIFDAGFGFGKTTKQNYQILGSLEKLQILDAPLLVGISRKTMIREVLDVSADEALNGTTALHAIALQKGAQILRVHDVKEAVETRKLVQELNNDLI